MASLDVNLRARPRLRRHLAAFRKGAGLVLLAALAFAFVIPILWMTVMSFQAGEKMFELRTEWIPSGLALRELSERAVARAVRAIFPQQRHRLACGDGWQRRVLHARRIWAGEIPLSRIESRAASDPVDVDAAARSDAGADVSGHPQVRMDQHLPGDRRAAADRCLRRLPDAPGRSSRSRRTISRRRASMAPASCASCCRSSCRNACRRCRCSRSSRSATAGTSICGR